MRKILIIVLIALLIFLGYVGFTRGISLGIARIKSFSIIQENFKELTDKIESINEKSNVVFANKKAELDKQFEEFTTLKQDYEKKIKSYSKNDDKAKNIFVYDIDFLWARIGTHATSEAVDIDLDIAENSSGTTAVGNYCLCDFYFTVRGEYRDITAFIYHMEDDEELSFSIENFKLLPLEKGKLVATFKVTEMPLNKEDLNISGSTLSSSANSTTNDADTKTDSNSNDVYTNNATGNAANKEGVLNAINNVLTEAVTKGIKDDAIDNWIISAENGSKIFDSEIKKQFKSTDKGSITSSVNKSKKYSGTATLDGVDYTWTSENGSVTLTQK